MAIGKDNSRATSYELEVLKGAKKFLNISYSCYELLIEGVKYELGHPASKPPP